MPTWTAIVDISKKLLRGNSKLFTSAFFLAFSVLALRVFDPMTLTESQRLIQAAWQIPKSASILILLLLIFLKWWGLLLFSARALVWIRRSLRLFSEDEHLIWIQIRFRVGRRWFSTSHWYVIVTAVRLILLPNLKYRMEIIDWLLLAPSIYYIFTILFFIVFPREGVGFGYSRDLVPKNDKQNQDQYTRTNRQDI